METEVWHEVEKRMDMWLSDAALTFKGCPACPAPDDILRNEFSRLVSLFLASNSRLMKNKTKQKKNAGLYTVSPNS